ncbi:MAG TPA: hypothetical protein VMW10_06900 [Alphaproteobacteria bacterium]|nr:hypothetical protein [Alphaproteobacteria bacterium]
MSENIKMTITFGNKSVDTDMDTLKQLNKELKSGKIKYVSDCCHGRFSVHDGWFCSGCGKECKPIPIREAS